MVPTRYPAARRSRWTAFLSGGSSSAEAFGRDEAAGEARPERSRLGYGCRERGGGDGGTAIE